MAVAQAGNSSDTYSGVVCDPKYTTKCDTLGKDFKGLYGGGGVYRLGYANNSAFVHSDSAYFTGAFQLLFRCNQTGFMSCEPWVSLPGQARAHLGDSTNGSMPFACGLRISML